MEEAYQAADNAATPNDGGWIILKRDELTNEYTFVQAIGSASEDEYECPFKFHVSIDPKQIVAGASIVLSVLTSHMQHISGIKIQNSKASDDAQHSKQMTIHFNWAQGDPCPLAKDLRDIFAEVDQRLVQKEIGVDIRPVNSEDNQRRRKYDRVIPRVGEGKLPRFSYRNELCTYVATPLRELLGHPSDVHSFTYPGVGLFIFDETYFSTLHKNEWHNPSKQNDPYMTLSY